MKKTILSLMLVALLVLAACAPAVTSSPTDAVTNTNTTSTPELGLPSPERSPQGPDELEFKVLTQMGGLFDAVAVDGNTVYLGIGPRFATVDISDPSSPR